MSNKKKRIAQITTFLTILLCFVIALMVGGCKRDDDLPTIAGEIASADVIPSSQVLVGQTVTFSCVVRNTSKSRHTFLVSLGIKGLTEAPPLTLIRKQIKLDPKQEQIVELLKFVPSEPGLRVFVIQLFLEEETKEILLDWKILVLIVAQADQTEGEIISAQMNPPGVIQAGHSAVFSCTVQNKGNNRQMFRVVLTLWKPEPPSFVEEAKGTERLTVLDPGQKQTIEIVHVFDSNQRGKWAYVFWLWKHVDLSAIALLDAKPSVVETFTVR